MQPLSVITSSQEQTFSSAVNTNESEGPFFRPVSPIKAVITPAAISSQVDMLQAATTQYTQCISVNSTENGSPNSDSRLTGKGKPTRVGLAQDDRDQFTRSRKPFLGLSQSARSRRQVVLCPPEYRLPKDAERDNMITVGTLERRKRDFRKGTLKPHTTPIPFDFDQLLQNSVQPDSGEQQPKVVPYPSAEDLQVEADPQAHEQVHDYTSPFLVMQNWSVKTPKAFHYVPRCSVQSYQKFMTPDVLSVQMDQGLQLLQIAQNLFPFHPHNAEIIASIGMTQYQSAFAERAAQTRLAPMVECPEFLLKEGEYEGFPLTHATLLGRLESMEILSFDIPDTDVAAPQILFSEEQLVRHQHLDPLQLAMTLDTTSNQLREKGDASATLIFDAAIALMKIIFAQIHESEQAGVQLDF